VTTRRRPRRAAFSEEDERYMRLALALSERARGRTRPNPVVGAVVVRGRRIVARGYHRRAGGPHAEVAALVRLGFRARGATLYVTLEPCCHSGRTGPCTEPIIASGIKRVVVGSVDHNPLVAGRGIARLRRAGIRVDVGCLEEACLAANRAFFKWIRDGRPHVTLKVAATLDGFIAAPSRPKRPGVQWITGPEARRSAHELRAAHDAVLVGAGTVLADDPRLTVRLPKGKGPRRARSHPLRVILDGKLRCPPKARLLSEPTGWRPLVLGADPHTLSPAERRAFSRRRRALEAAGGEVTLLPADREGRIPLDRALRFLAARGVQSLLVEGGSQVHGAFIAARLVDEVAVFLAPRLQGAGRPIAIGLGLPWTRPLHLGPLRVRHVGGDILLSAGVPFPKGGPHR
jgi:diaminohydroxyphosphoribosylaminopyrimidine deaminase / 5-amino-6-(5-phosphoribosylamino)uracil reductase